MPTHTPGPWRQVDVRNQFDQVERVVVKGTSVIATIGHRHIEAEREANARLIASAPDLLAALERISQTGVVGGCSPQALLRGYHELQDIARSALALANPPQ